MRYKLRTLFVAVTLFSLWFAHVHRQDVKRKRFIAALEKVGGRAIQDGKWRPATVGINIPWEHRRMLTVDRLDLFPQLKNIGFIDFEIMTARAGVKAALLPLKADFCKRQLAMVEEYEGPIPSMAQVDDLDMEWVIAFRSP